MTDPTKRVRLARSLIHSRFGRRGQILDYVLARLDDLPPDTSLELPRKELAWWTGMSAGNASTELRDLIARSVLLPSVRRGSPTRYRLNLEFAEWRVPWCVHPRDALLRIHEHSRPSEVVIPGLYSNGASGVGAPDRLGQVGLTGNSEQSVRCTNHLVANSRSGGADPMGQVEQLSGSGAPDCMGGVGGQVHLTDCSPRTPPPGRGPRDVVDLTPSSSSHASAPASARALDPDRHDDDDDVVEIELLRKAIAKATGEETTLVGEWLAIVAAALRRHGGGPCLAVIAAAGARGLRPPGIIEALRQAREAVPAPPPAPPRPEIPAPGHEPWRIPDVEGNPEGLAALRRAMNASRNGHRVGD